MKPHKPMTPRKIAQTIFREWCAYHGAVVDVEMAASLVRRIENAITEERARQSQSSAVRESE